MYMKKEKWYTVREIRAMKIDGFKTLVTIWKYIASGDLKATDLADKNAKQRKLRIKESDLQKFLKGYHK